MDGHLGLDLGVPLTLIAEAVFARCLSAQKDERVGGVQGAQGGRDEPDFGDDQKQFIDDIEMALYASKIISYAQGYALMKAMAERVGLGDQQRRGRPDVAGRLHHPQRLPGQDQGGVRPQPEADEPAARPVLHRRDRAGPGGLAAGRRGGASGRASRCPAMASALAYFDGYRTAACRPTCSRPSATTSAPTPTSAIDSPRGQFFHTNWTGRGGDDVEQHLQRVMEIV